MNINAVSKDCIGCAACMDICALGAISIHCDSEGFYKPQVDDKCINCGKCLKKCPANTSKTEKKVSEFYYGWILDDTVRKNSSSGGFFSSLANYVLSSGGVVFGAAYSNDFKSVVMESTEDVSLDALRVSKYCQAFSNGMHNKIADHLKKGRKVLVVGTPCQIASLRLRFANNENLLLVDFFCGGIAPVSAYSNYIEYLEKCYKSKVISVNMRDKSLGWNLPKIRVKFENGKVYSKRYQFDYYCHYFYGKNIKNLPCLTCKFTNHTDADITIGDFWGYKSANVSNDGKGISLIAINTENGKIALDCVKTQLQLYSLDEKYAKYAYRGKDNNTQIIKQRNEFMEDVKKHSFVYAAKKHDFRYGSFGVLLKILIRKVVRK